MALRKTVRRPVPVLAVLVGVLVALSVAVSTGPWGQAAASALSDPVGGAVAEPTGLVPDRVIVRFEAGADRDAVAEAAGAQERASLGFPGAEVWRVDDPAAVVALLTGHPEVRYAERDHYVHAQRTPNDTLWSSQWGARKVDAPRAWDTTTGDSGVTIAVLDTGLDLDHEDIGGVVEGRNIVDNVLEDLTQTVRDVIGLSDTDDVNGHGTSSTSVAASRADNTRGVAGLCWECSVMPVKVLSDSGTGTLSDLAAGVAWATDAGADVINMSLGSPSRTQAIQDAVTYADERGALLIGAAGNAGIDEKFYPAALDEVLGVAASDPDDNRFAFSNFGDWVEVAAPGCNPAAKPLDLYTPSFCGTSSAAPVVAGIAGLALAGDPTATADEVHAELTATAVDVGDFVTHGRVDAAATVAAFAEPAPSPDEESAEETADDAEETADDAEETADDAEETEQDTGDGDGGSDEPSSDPGDDAQRQPPPACPDGDVPDAGFTDTAGNPHADNIDCVAWYGIAQGTGQDTYSPALPVRRDQMATFLVRFLETADAELPPAERQGFTDVDGNPHAERIRQLAALDIVRGTSPDTYSPALPVRRDQMATFLVRAYEYLHGQELPAPPSGFTDVEGNPHRTNIAKSAAAGLAQGTGPNTYSPALPVRRDQMATFLARTLELAASDGHVTPP